MIDPTVKYILTQHSSFLYQYGFDGFRKRNINVQKIVSKLVELYGKNYNGEQFIEFGEKFLNDYLFGKHGLTFNDFLLESFQPIIHRFRHLS